MQYCYRITHMSNLDHVLTAGLVTKSHAAASGSFVSIGNPDIISVRDTTPVKLEGFGNIGAYVPFYFTPKSMMLFNIVTGYRATVPKRPKSEILIIRCEISTLFQEHQCFFTDGQANVGITKHLDELSALDQIDWTSINSCNFKKDGTDPDRARRYQAEFLVHNNVPLQHIESFHIFDTKTQDLVLAAQARLKVIPVIPTHVTPNYYF
jgi:ssDNA thymidine ADP-ribosyltransferase, DarT